MTDAHRLTGTWTPRRQALAYQHVLDSIARARQTVVEFTEAGQHARDKALRSAADALLVRREDVVAANEADLAEARQSRMDSGGLDRLALSHRRVTELADYLVEVAESPSPLTLELPARSQVARVPLGVVGVIYEPQPATTVLATAPVLKAGNAVVLRGSAAAARTDAALVALLRDALRDADLSADCVQALSVAERATVRYLVAAEGLVDLVLMRAGRSLAGQARSEARVALSELSYGICHVYLDATADAALARQIVLDSTLIHPSWAGAAHTVLVHTDATELLPALLTDVIGAGVVVHGDDHVTALDPAVIAVSENDWRDESLTPCLAIRVVSSLEDALAHIEQFGTGHTETIVTADRSRAGVFATRVNAATVAVNTVTVSGELTITQKAHSRGPLNPELFTTSKQIAWPA